MLIVMLEANGINSREEQAQLLRDTFDLDITAHQLSVALSRNKQVKSVPEKLVNMSAYTRTK